jgi:putative addiction module component (TIGR02574 family)
MSEAGEKLKTELARLSIEDRAQLAHFLLHSLDGEPDDQAEAAWDAELARRFDEINAGHADGMEAEQVFAALREKYS